MSEVKEYDVTFGAVSPQVETVRIGMKFDRAHLTKDEAETLFCGSQLSAKIAVDKNAENDDPNQQTAINTDFELELNGTSKQYTVDPKQITASLTMTYEDALCEKLLHFRYRKGRISCHRTGNAPDKDGKTLFEGEEGSEE